MNSRLNLKKRIKPFIPRSSFDYGFLMFIIKTVFSYSNVISLTSYFEILLDFCGIAFFAVSILKQRFNYSMLIVYLLLIILSLYTSLAVGDFYFMTTIITVLAIRNKNIDNKFRFLFLWELFFVAIEIIIFAISIPFGFSPFTIVNGEEYINFGFTHPNVMGILVSNLLLLWSWCNYEKIKWWNILIISIIELSIYSLTGCRSMLYMFIVFTFLITLIKAFKKFNTILSIIASVIIPIMAVIFLFAITNKENDVSIYLNKLLTGRIKYGAYAYEHVGLTFFGQNVNKLYNVKWDMVWQLNSFTYDCFYTMIATKNGIIWLILLAISFWKLAKIRDPRTSVVLICYAIYGSAEVHVINCYMLFPIILTASLLFSPQHKGRFLKIYKSGLYEQII